MAVLWSVGLFLNDNFSYRSMPISDPNDTEANNAR